MKFKNKIVLGTMKLKKYFKNSKELSKFLDYAHTKGIRQLHISNEYSSYKLIKKIFSKISKKKFTLIIKLAEPKKDQIKFNLKRFERKVIRYRQDLGEKHNYIIQYVNRYRCNNDVEYLNYEQRTFDAIKNTINKFKSEQIIKNFYFFPYFINESKIKKHNFIDGISVYRNLNEKKNDNYAKKNNFKIIAMRVFGGNKKILNKKNYKKLLLFNIKNKLVKKVIIGANNTSQLNDLLKLC